MGSKAETYMPKKKTSSKLKKSLGALKKTRSFDFNQMESITLKKGVKLVAHDPNEFLVDAAKIKEALMEALFDGDVDSFKDILAAHLGALDKANLSKASGVSRATVFRMLSHNSNPSLENVAKVLKTLKSA
jgi:probable addiction module antidote protein